MQDMDSKTLLLNKINTMESQYNPEIRMLRSPFSSPGYHTAIKKADFIHSTYKSLLYALGLLDTEREDDILRAFDIIEQVTAMQDTDRSRSTFGIWPWYYEETLEQMSPPDWNWADFCGKQLVLALARHGWKFPDGLRASVQQAICHACDAIIIRDIGPHYTNIAIMGAFVTLIAGELFDRTDYEQYGLKRLEKLHQFTRQRGAFQEYNSPTYTTIAILELSKIGTYTNNAAAKERCEDLLDLAWKSVAEHYHAATGQWAGPHSRSYQTLLGDQHKAFLQVATGGQLAFFPWEELPYDEEWYNSGIHCPQQHMRHFFAAEEREFKQLFALSGVHSADEKWAATYMTPDYTLGSFSREIMWNQTRVLLAYADNRGEPTYLHLRCLHDGYDYCSAIFHSVQRRGQLLFGIHFITNGGDTHPNLDKIDGTIEAEDFRLRLEIGGCLERVRGTAEPGGAEVRIDNRLLKLVTGYAAFEAADDRYPNRWQWELTEEDGVLGVDLVIHSGGKRTIDFRKLNKAAFLFTLSVEEAHGGAPFIPTIEETDGRIIGKAAWGDEQLALSLPLAPVEA